MKHRLIHATCAAFLAACAIATAPAYAQDAEVAESAEEQPAFSVDASIELVSDYRFRGISLADFDPAVQPSLTISHASGVYLNAWGSNTADNGGADMEVDFTLGWWGELGGGTSLDVYAMQYFYPDASDLNYAEFGASLSQEVGSASVSAQVIYAPSQDGTGNLDNIYLGVAGEMPVGETPVTLRGSLGYEDGAFGDDKIDWLVGAEYDLGAGFAAGVSYVDSYRSQIREGRAGALANLRFEF
jgi:uncharacterized protein (TIGR02001 family)